VTQYQRTDYTTLKTKRDLLDGRKGKRLLGLQKVFMRNILSAFKKILSAFKKILSAFKKILSAFKKT
jgi:hypothetical protein